MIYIYIYICFFPKFSFLLENNMKQQTPENKTPRDSQTQKQRDILWHFLAASHGLTQAAKPWAFPTGFVVKFIFCIKDVVSGD